MQPHVVEKLRQSEARYEQLMKLVSDPAVQSDGNAYRKYSKELSDVQPLVEHFHEFQKIEAEAAQAREMAASGDAEMATMASEELAVLDKQREALEQRIKLMLVPKDPNDEKNVM